VLMLIGQKIISGVDVAVRMVNGWVIAG
jgi:hypothetical protein